MTLPLTRDRLCGNAYRTLGLSGSATQAQVDAAARRMRIWPDPSRIPPTPWDLPWLGPLLRARTDIEQAVARLADPQARLWERVSWYLTPEPPPPGPPLPIAKDTPADFSQRHAAVIASLQAALTADPASVDTSRWQRVLVDLGEVAGSEEGREWLAECEARSNSEVRASSQEVADALKSLPTALALAMLPMAREALERSQLEAAAGLLATMRGNDTSGQAQKLVDELLNRLEDEFKAECAEFDKELRDVLRIVHDDPKPWHAKNLQPTFRGQAVVDVRLKPGLKKLETLAGEDEDRLIRCRSRMADALTLLATGWEWSGRLDRALQTLEEAIPLAIGSQTEDSVRAEHARVNELRQKELARFAPPPPLATFAPAPPAWSGQAAPAFSQTYRPTPVPVLPVTHKPSFFQWFFKDRVSMWIGAVAVILMIGAGTMSALKKPSRPSGSTTGIVKAKRPPVVVPKKTPPASNDWPPYELPKPTNEKMQAENLFGEVNREQ